MAGFETSFGVDDLKTTIAAVEADGGKIVMQPYRIEGLGELILFRGLRRQSGRGHAVRCRRFRLIADQKPFDIAGFQKLDAVVDVWAAKVTGYPAPLGDVRLHLQLKDGRMDIRPFAANSSPGRIEATLAANASQNGLAVRADTAVRGVRAERLTASTSLSRVFDGAAHLTAIGRSQKHLISNAQGGLAFRLKAALSSVAWPTLLPAIR